MSNLFYKGENILIRWSLVDKYNAPIAFSGLTDLIIVVKDKQGTSVTFSKIAGTVTAVSGGPSNQFEFEITEAMSAAFGSGKLIARFTYKIPSGDYESNVLVDIAEEGITSEFITLQE
jgi:hypothetical protein